MKVRSSAGYFVQPFPLHEYPGAQQCEPQQVWSPGQQPDPQQIEPWELEQQCPSGQRTPGGEHSPAGIAEPPGARSSRFPF